MPSGLVFAALRLLLPVILGMAAGAYAMNYHWQPRYALLASQFEQFKGRVAGVGEAQNARSARQALADLKAKERADEEHDRRTADAGRIIAGLRRTLDAERAARGGDVPPAPAGSSCPDGLVCFDAAEFGAARREHRDAIRRAADEGAALERALKTAREWARESRPQP